MRRTCRWVGPLVLLALVWVAPGARAEEERVELGRVAWERDFPAATARAEATGRPILLLFQEVPG